MFLRLRPFRLVAFVLMDKNLFRHALEERLKSHYIVRAPLVGPELDRVQSHVG
jgi:hypothetical protein